MDNDFGQRLVRIVCVYHFIFKIIKSSTFVVFIPIGMCIRVSLNEFVERNFSLTGEKETRDEENPLRYTHARENYIRTLLMGTHESAERENRVKN